MNGSFTEPVLMYVRIQDDMLMSQKVLVKLSKKPEIQKNL